MDCSIKSRLVELKLAESKVHHVLPKSKEYDLRRLEFLWDGDESENRCLELELSSYDEYVTLSFSGIQDLQIEASELLTAISIEIIDAREYLPEMPAPIRVQGHGLCFWAEDVKKSRVMAR